jgi:hypothetical protein
VYQSGRTVELGGCDAISLAAALIGSFGAIAAKPPRLEFRHQLLAAHGGAFPLY